MLASITPSLLLLSVPIVTAEEPQQVMVLEFTFLMNETKSRYKLVSIVKNSFVCVKKLRNARLRG
jgi:hypothetical protein